MEATYENLTDSQMSILESVRSIGEYSIPTDNPCYARDLKILRSLEKRCILYSEQEEEDDIIIFKLRKKNVASIPKEEPIPLENNGKAPSSLIIKTGIAVKLIDGREGIITKYCSNKELWIYIPTKEYLDSIGLYQSPEEYHEVLAKAKKNEAEFAVSRGQILENVEIISKFK